MFTEYTVWQANTACDQNHKTEAINNSKIVLLSVRARSYLNKDDVSAAVGVSQEPSGSK